MSTLQQAVEHWRDIDPEFYAEAEKERKELVSELLQRRKEVMQLSSANLEVGLLNVDLQVRVQELETRDVMLNVERGEALAEVARVRVDLQGETMWAKHYADRAQEFRDAIAPLLAYRNRNTTNFQLEKLDDYLNRLRELMEKQP